MENFDEASHNNDTEEGTSILYRYYNTVMALENKTTTKLWEVLIECVHVDRKKNADFYMKPEWDEIRKWLQIYSFKFCLHKNSIEADFDMLVKECNNLVDLFQSNSCIDGDMVSKACFDYLSLYYNLIIRLEQSGILRDDLSYSSAFLQMMMTGYCCPGFDEYKKSSSNGYCYFYHFYSPIFLEKLCLFFDFLKDGGYHGNDINVKKMGIFNDVIREKFMKMFFADVNISGKRYVITCYNVEYPYLIERDYLSSVEPIRPVRWIEKIRSYIKCCSNLENGIPKNQDGSYEIKIAAIGYVKLDKGLKDGKRSSKELEMFCETLNLLYPEDKFKFKVEVFVNKHDKYFDFEDRVELLCNNTVSISLQKVDYSKLFIPGNNDKIECEGITEIIENYNIVLILDVPNLYTHEYKLLRRSSRDFPDGSFYDKYIREYNKQDFKNNDFLVSNYRYAPIHFLASKLNLFAMNSSAYEDTLEYNINTPLIDYLHGYVERKAGGLKDVHIFISSQDSIDYSKYVEENFTRQERYNGKNFYLVMLRNKKNGLIKPYVDIGDNKKNYIVFSLWNLLKNVDYYIFENKKFYGEILDSTLKEVFYLAMHVSIKMKWSDSFGYFRFELCDSKDGSKLANISWDLLKEMLNSLFKIILSAENDLFSRCIRHSFLNTIYSQMQFLDDVVFYCLFYREFPREKPVVIDVVINEFDEEPVFSVNQPVFWTVARTIRSLNSKFFLGDQLLEIKRDFRKNSKDYSFGKTHSVLFLLELTKSICEKYGYENSYLYRNVCSILD